VQQLGPVVDDLGTRLTLDRDAAEQVFAFMQDLTGKSGLMPGTATPVTVSTLFGQGKAGFLFDGVWQIPTYRGLKNLHFDVRPFGKILGDSHVNIAGMQVSRDEKGGHALVALSVDSAIPTEVLAQIVRSTPSGAIHVTEDFAAALYAGAAGKHLRTEYVGELPSDEYPDPVRLFSLKP